MNQKNRHIVNRDEVAGIACSVVPPVLNLPSLCNRGGVIPLGLSGNGDIRGCLLDKMPVVFSSQLWGELRRMIREKACSRWPFLPERFLSAYSPHPRFLCAFIL